jgi:23S rRNA (pseudouridine1915-N3)-methyltransferase
MAHSTFDGLRARQDESERILSRLSAYDFIVLLDERGKEFDSPTIAKVLEEQLDQSHKVLIIIGGAFGVTDELRQKVDLVWSLSPLVFPHQLVRLILIEQLYRGQQITLGGSYHHE